MILNKRNFYINGLNGEDDLHAVLENYPTISIPKRKKTMTVIEGSNEQIILDEGAYDNREIDLNIIVHAVDEEDRVTRMSALISAFDSPGYIGFIHYGEPNYEYEVTNAEIATPTRLTRISYSTEVKIKLSAKAFKYYKPDEKQEFETTGEFYNRFNFPSRPLIHVGTVGVAYITINGINYTFQNIPTGGAWIDCDESQQDVYTDSGLIESAFNLGQEFPELPPGKVIVKAPSAIVYPRWRTL
ncbi:hypothetical protein [Companilactobacillus mishanensis]|uniref:Phage tail protein n=1 Tax=Companilactobacillus mishanensis TaxID=2486008 RepID=A0A5P0ZGR0_9LACO|nr:hypothetical protein [Companilactobacillus mishanensis]MQS52175.1 hypothetical protein [Companilactobacillus mishanensis]